ncbi:MAG: amidohydrolase family protein [Clostridiales bacterium]|nr:amidohydrolase family protein [Clostridiales bacterium]
MTTHIYNAKICDGTGAPVWRGGILFSEQGILDVYEGEKDLTADEAIDAHGRLVTPGFIDIHRHCDIMPFYGTAYGTTMLRQGITTTVVGNCGISPTPAPEQTEEMYAYYEPVLGPLGNDLPRTYPAFRAGLKDLQLPVDTAAMIGTGAVRIAVKGFSNSPWTADELEQGRALIEEAMKAGAPGVSLGIMYLPECYGTVEEFAALLEPVGRYDGVITTHIRGEGDSLVASVEEVIEIARRAGCALEISHFKSCGMKNWRHAIHEAIQRIEVARAAGQDVTCDFYPYAGGSTALTTMLPPAFVQGDLKSALERLGTEEGVLAFRRSVQQEWPDWDNYAISLGWDRILISGVILPEFESLRGLDMVTAAKQAGYKDAVSLAAAMMYKEQGRTAIINLSMSEQDVDTVAQLPYAILISDSIYADTKTPHPRMHGTFPKFLREYVRKKRLLTLEEAVHKMTQMPALRMRLKEKGVLVPGFAADLLLFDEATFTDRATYEDPARQAEGMDQVWIGGRKAVEDGRLLRLDLGHLL